MNLVVDDNFNMTVTKWLGLLLNGAFGLDRIEGNKKNIWKHAIPFFQTFWMKTMSFAYL